MQILVPATRNHSAEFDAITGGESAVIARRVDPTLTSQGHIISIGVGSATGETIRVSGYPPFGFLGKDSPPKLDGSGYGRGYPSLMRPLAFATIQQS